MVVPRGMTNSAVEVSTFNFFSAVSIVSGIVAAELEVENASNCAGPIFCKKVSGFSFPIKNARST